MKIIKKSIGMERESFTSNSLKLRFNSLNYEISSNKKLKGI